jgi:Tfp pilus assembly PilM family ATPase
VLAKLLKNFRWHRTADRWGPRRITVVDLAADATRIAVVSRAGGQMTWETARSLPKVDDDFTLPASELASELRDAAGESQYAAAVISGGNVFVRLLNFPGQPLKVEALRNQVRQTLGVDETYTVLHQIVRRSEQEEKNPEYSVLAVAFPSEKVEALEKIIESAGLKPVSLIPSGVAAANLAEAAPEKLEEDSAVGFMQIGAGHSILLLYSGKTLALARQFKLGVDSFVESLMAAFDLDYATADKLFKSGSFDFSENISAAVNSWMHQVSISLDFIERRYGKRVESLQLLGPGAGLAVLKEVFATSIGHKVDVWNVFDLLDNLQPPADLEESPEMFALALCEAKRIMRRGLEHGA